MHWEGIKSRLQSYRSINSLKVDLVVMGTNFVYSLLERFSRHQVTCSLCNWTGLAFRGISFGGWKALNQLCPKCNSYPRHRSLAQMIYKQGWNSIQGKILDIGAGASLQTVFTQDTQIYLKADIQKDPDVTQVFDIQFIPYSNQSMNMVVCLHVLDHVPNDIAAVREIVRILKPKGICILQGRIDPNQKITVDYFPKHSPHHPLQYRDYGKDFEQRFNSAHIRLEPLTYGNEIFYIGTLNA